ncbi:SPOR domain-containing protein [Massilia norwichensis]|uniref:SPOR domain-containing protein n=1 Tax=Massilia norwichensis TaxID=1442366 RepID=A0ABT2ACY8_9BURK|nr:SPOR domain-containing protein [Massilia norwichensis]
MLRFVFWSLLFLNAALFVYAQGFMGSSKGSEEERARIKPQLEPARLTLLTSEQAEAAKAAPVAASAAEAEASAPAAQQEAPAEPVPAPAPAKPLACIDVGTFSAGESKRFESRLASLDLGERQSRQAVQAQDVTSYLVNIPPQASKDAAERKAGELRERGVTNFFIMSGDSPMKWAISLGVFKTESGAQTLLAQLNKQGVHSARITPRGPQTTRYSYRFRDIEAAQRERIVSVADAVSSAEVKNCR